MTAPRLPGVGFADGAAAQSAAGPRIFVDGAWRSVTELAAQQRPRVLVPRSPARSALETMTDQRRLPAW